VVFAGRGEDLEAVQARRDRTRRPRGRGGDGGEWDRREPAVLAERSARGVAGEAREGFERGPAAPRDERERGDPDADGDAERESGERCAAHTDEHREQSAGAEQRELAELQAK